MPLRLMPARATQTGLNLDGMFVNAPPDTAPVVGSATPPEHFAPSPLPLNTPTINSKSGDFSYMLWTATPMSRLPRNALSVIERSVISSLPLDVICCRENGRFHWPKRNQAPFEISPSM